MSPRRLFLALLVALAVLALGTTLIATQTPRVHARLMQQLADSGLLREQRSDFEAGWLQAHSSGELQLARSLCGGCDQLQYAGKVNQGVGAWLAGDLALLSLDYQLTLPQLPIEPALPPLALSATQNLGALEARLALPASAHEHHTAQHIWTVQQSGLRGRIAPGRLQLHGDALELHRDAAHWLRLGDMQLQAAAGEQFMLSLQAQQFAVPVWSWQAREARVEYAQQGEGRRLDLQLQLDVPSGRVSGQAPHPPLQARAELRQLDLPATRAFIERLPGLMATDTPPAARMFGLLSLYSVHGPAFFAAAPALQLDAGPLPLSGGAAEIAIDLQVMPGIRRPPMHPVEWRQALQGEVDVVAPRRHLSQWWGSLSALLHTVTGLPRNYAGLLSQGWVVPQADGRDRLFFRLDPARGPQPAG